MRPAWKCPLVAAPWMARLLGAADGAVGRSGPHQQAQRRRDRIRQQIGGGGQPATSRRERGNGRHRLAKQSPAAGRGGIAMRLFPGVPVSFIIGTQRIDIDIDAGDQVDR